MPHRYKRFFFILLIFGNSYCPREKFISDFTFPQPNLPLRPRGNHHNSPNSLTLKFLITDLVLYLATIFNRLPFRNQINNLIKEIFICSFYKVVRFCSMDNFCPLFFEPSLRVFVSLDGYDASHSINSISCSEYFLISSAFLR